MPRSCYELWYGRDAAPSPLTHLQAGPVEAWLDEGDLRYVEVDGIEVIRRLHVAVRDPGWGTAATELSALDIDAQLDRFRVRFVTRHYDERIDFRWRGLIEGRQDGSLCYEVQGEALRSFAYANIGLCVLLPFSTAAGRPFRARTAGGSIMGVLPATIAPQVIVAGRYRPVVPPACALELDASAGLTVAFAYSGDTFATEDQRNWTDASFKTYPSTTPQPPSKQLAMRRSQSITQRVTMTPYFHGPRPCRSLPRLRSRPHGGGVAFMLGTEPGPPLPAVGLGCPTAEDARPTGRELERLRQLRLSHIRVDVDLTRPGALLALARAGQTARDVACSLELALCLDDRASAELAELAEQLRASPASIARVLVFHRSERATANHWVGLARSSLGSALPGVPFLGGTDIYFADLNRSRPPVDDVDGVAYPITPQVHAFDERSLVETIAGQAETVRTAHTFCGGRPLVISPVTLRPRRTPEGVPHPAPAALDARGLPSTVDARQPTLFGAGWTLATLAVLTRCEVQSTTLYETIGWRGVMESERPPARPAAFTARAGETFPVYHVLADIGELRDGVGLPVCSQLPEALDGLAMRRDSGQSVLVANLTEQPLRATIGSLTGKRARVRMLSHTNAESAMRDPGCHRSADWRAATVSNGMLELGLTPFAYARIDVEAD